MQITEFEALLSATEHSYNEDFMGRLIVCKQNK